jgi:hypothetical protein
MKKIYKTFDEWFKKTYSLPIPGEYDSYALKWMEAAAREAWHEAVEVYKESQDEHIELSNEYKQMVTEMIKRNKNIKF